MSPTREARFQWLFTTHRDAVWSYCYRRVGRDEVADTVAEVFLVAWRRIDQVPSSNEETLLWLYGVARNVVRNVTRTTQRRLRLRAKLASLREPDAAAPDTQLVRRAEDQELLAAVAQLKPSEQELLRLRTWEELSLAEVAAVAGLSVRSVESRLARVRKRLAAQLDVPSGNPGLVRPRPVEEGGER